MIRFDENKVTNCPLPLYPPRPRVCVFVNSFSIRHNQPLERNRQIVRCGQWVKINWLHLIKHVIQATRVSARARTGQFIFFFCSIQRATSITMCVAERWTQNTRQQHSTLHLTNYNDKTGICHVIIFHVRVQFFILVFVRYLLYWVGRNSPSHRCWL